MIQKKFLGDLDTCLKWFKYYFPLISNFNLGDGEKKTFIKEDVVSGKDVKVFIQIKYLSPDYHFLVAVLNKSQGGNLSSGLTIDELNDNTFKLFYPRDGDGFKEYSNLLRSNDILTHEYLPYFNKYNGKLINQNHYINGRQFTGSLGEQVQNMLGTTNIDIGYSNLWIHSNGFYLDSKNNYWLITIKCNNSTDTLKFNHGVFARQITLDNYTDGVIKKVNNQTSTVNYKLADGLGYLDGDNLLLSMQGFYSTHITGWYTSFPLSINQGWSFNKKGNKICNLSYKDGKSWLYEITINEVINDGVISLSASYQVKEYLTFIIPDRLSILSCLYSNYSNYSLEDVSNLNYSQVKNNPLIKLKSGGGLGNQKIPLQVYYDEEDKLKVIYYYQEEIIEEIENESTSGFINSNDFWNKSSSYPFYLFKYIGDLTSGDFDTKRTKTTLKNGIKKNDEIIFEQNSIEDGVATKFKKCSLANGTFQTDIVYKVKNSLYPIDLSSYTNFSFINLENEFNSKIKIFQSYYLQYMNSYYYTTEEETNAENNTLRKFKVQQDYVLDKQFKDINDMLQKLNTDLSLKSTFKSLNTVNELLEIKKLNKISINDLDIYPYRLYEFNNNCLSIMDKYNSTYINELLLKLDNINTIMNTYIGLSYVNYYKDLRKNYKNLITYFRNIQDKSTLNVSLINTYIDDLNTNHIPLINSFINSLNNIITNINNEIDSLNQNYTDINLWNSYVLGYLNSIKGFQGIKLEKIQLGSVYIGYNNTDYYYLGKKIYARKDTIEYGNKNRIVNDNAIIFNNGNRNSINLYNEKRTYNGLNKVNDGYQEILICESNEYCLYKQNNNNGVLSDFIVVEEFTNYKHFEFTDYNGFTVSFNAGNNKYYKDNNFSLYENNISYSTGYMEIYLISGFTTILKNQEKYHLTDMSIKYKQNSDDSFISEAKMITIDSKENIIQNLGEAKLDYRITNSFKNAYDNSGYLIDNDAKWLNNYYYPNKNQYGQPYFNMFRDYNSFNYIISKDIYSQNDNKLILTNISKYNIINTNHVNFIGLAFDKQ